MSSEHEQFLSQFAEQRSALREAEKDEILLIENKRRFVMFPIKYHEIWAAYKKLEATFWPAEEVDLTKDVDDFKKLNEDQKDFFARYLAAATTGEANLVNHLIERFSAELQNPEGKSFYGFQIMAQNVYDEAHSMMIDTFFDGAEKVKYLNEFPTSKEVTAKLNFRKEWIESPESLYGERLVALAAKEALFLAGARAVIFWFISQGLFHGVTHGISNITRDRGFYSDFNCLLFAHLKNKPNAKVVEKIIVDATEIEKNYMADLLKVEQSGLKSAQVNQYVEFLADSLLASFGNEKHYNAANPFEFMEGKTTIGKTNFFEKTVSDYTKANESTTKAASHEGFAFNESF
ncbi:hypothetical protein KAFR_0D01760 [Kazachstania africana CBS 2517]|uniref:Uncharacterized protein n=1 Tax=Kazachstania africana (strain ATCC 22294 / BCRC 22015 / CBS 2517 / CECT 1963 / NBRC 1671 / NRRL Y-8276) TaxID=1071382 RepID=H2ATX3_KAZAF|nr:hypothetical protein KAFR_0D01760 [Kazachstania africana CBS 2517]CCF57823.1 hypothetical protein KAFR_0D01760 [Kazachstania africana CBS 2517]